MVGRFLQTTIPVLVLLMTFMAPSSVLGDGLLPPQPYHYLHPPASLSSGNNPPSSGETGVTLHGGRQTDPSSFFTPDGQFGVDLDAGTLRAPPSVNTIRLRIDPVTTPPGLPNGLTADGNAYRVTATQLPSNRPAAPRRTYGIVLRWPRIPHAIYRYDGSAWHLLCTAQQWEVSTATVLCRTRELGTFLAVRPGTIAPQTSTSNLRRFLPLILAAFVVVLAALAALVVTRKRAFQNDDAATGNTPPPDASGRDR